MGDAWEGREGERARETDFSKYLRTIRSRSHTSPS